MSHKGTSTFIIQRATSVLLIPLAVWLLVNLVSLLGADYESARAALRSPWNALPFGAFVIIGAWHTRIGAAEIIIDYIHSWAKDVLQVVNWLAALGMIAATLWSIYILSFAG